MSSPPAPSHILIIGAGVFGLSTARSLLQRPTYTHTNITLLDASPTLPNPAGSSVDSSRIIRPDYSNLAYARLAAKAQLLWRDTSPGGWGAEGRYQQPGLLLTCSPGQEGYVRRSLENVRALARDGLEGLDGKMVHELGDRDAIRAASGHEGVSGERGYVNWGSGWADAEKCVAYALDCLKKEGGERVEVRADSRMRRLLFDDEETSRCTGVELDDGTKLSADLIVLAAGAWTPSLVDMQGRALATGQALAYLSLSEAEQESLGRRPTVLNMSTGMFIIPPRGRELKVARNGYGYRNLKMLPGFKDPVSVPETSVPIPPEAERACAAALAEIIPSLAGRKFSHTRICWYCDTPDGDWIIDAHPRHVGLFIVTGGSGHAFKFFPVIGDKIVDAMEGRLEPELRRLWAWRAEPVAGFTGTEDGSRGGVKGMLLREELERSGI